MRYNNLSGNLTTTELQYIEIVKMLLDLNIDCVTGAGTHQYKKTFEGTIYYFSLILEVRNLTNSLLSILEKTKKDQQFILFINN